MILLILERVCGGRKINGVSLCNSKCVLVLKGLKEVEVEVETVGKMSYELRKGTQRIRN